MRGATGSQDPLKHLSSWLIIACGVWLVGLGFYFAVLRPPLLPEDPRYIGNSISEIQAAIPGLGRWLGQVFTVMGGFMAAAGMLTVFVGLRVVPKRVPGTGWALALSGLLSVVLMSVTNFAIGSDFRWLLLVPALLWVIALGSYLLRR